MEVEEEAAEEEEEQVVEEEPSVKKKKKKDKKKHIKEEPLSEEEPCTSTAVPVCDSGYCSLSFEFINNCIVFQVRNDQVFNKENVI